MKATTGFIVCNTRERRVRPERFEIPFCTEKDITVLTERSQPDRGEPITRSMFLQPLFGRCSHPSKEFQWGASVKADTVTIYPEPFVHRRI